jgi:hypothetical protein
VSEGRRAVLVASDCNAPLLVRMPSGVTAQAGAAVAINADVTVASGCATGASVRLVWTLTAIQPAWNPAINPVIATALNRSAVILNLPAASYVRGHTPLAAAVQRCTK